jgi:hypothetical protein
MGYSERPTHQHGTAYLPSYACAKLSAFRHVRVSSGTCRNRWHVVENSRAVEFKSNVCLRLLGKSEVGGTGSLTSEERLVRALV